MQRLLQEETAELRLSLLRAVVIHGPLLLVRSSIGDRVALGSACCPSALPNPPPSPFGIIQIPPHSNIGALLP